MNRFNTSACIVPLLGLALGAPAFAATGPAQLTPSGYGFSHSPGYEDSGGELTNGVTGSRAWGGGQSINATDVAELVGWQGVDVVITFTFAAPVTIGSISAYFADSDGSAGVGMPSSVTLFDGVSFGQTFPVIDPVGAGSTVETVFSGFEITTDTLYFTFTRSHEWTMLSEVQFFAPGAIPEPSAFATFAGFAALAGALGRRRGAARR